MDDPTGMMARALAATGKVFGAVSPELYEAPTPCPEWNVRTLMNHIVAGNRYFVRSALGEKPDPTIWATDHLGDAAPGDVFDDSAQAALRAWRAPGATDRTATLPSGGQGPRIYDLHLTDVFMHGWDLATATKQDRSLDDEVAEALYDAWYDRVPDELRGGSVMKVFGPAVQAPAEAPIADRLAAYLGRTP